MKMNHVLSWEGSDRDGTPEHPPINATAWLGDAALPAGRRSRRFAALLIICLCLFASRAFAAPLTGLDLRTVEKLLSLALPGESTVYIDDMGFQVRYLEELRAHLSNAPKAGSATNITKWTNGTVPYVFNSNVDSTNRQLFVDACDEWSKYAKVTFVPRTNQTNYVMVNSSSGNSATVGMQGGVQNINIFNWAFKYIICHEIAHCMGVCHEQSRSDRDTYVTINSANIQPGTEHNFNKLTTNNPGPYDFGSVMHYGPTAFSVNGNDTITPKAAYAAQASNMGQRSSLSVADRQGMASLYGGPNLKFYNPGWTEDVILSNSTDNNTDRTSFGTGETIYVDLAPWNSGTIPVPSDWSVRIYVDGVQKFSRVNGPGLGANTYYNDYLDLSLGTLTAGTHTVRVVVDVLNDIGETDESVADNERTRTITVTSSASIAVSASPAAGGSVTGGGSFTVGSSRTVTATPNAGYAFVNWTEDSTVVSTSASYTFTLNGSRTLVANFALISQAPAISTITAQTMDEDAVLGPLSFTVSDQQSPASALTVTASSSNPALVPNNSTALQLGGSASNRTLTVRPAANAFGSTEVTLTVSDGTNSTPMTFSVTVNAVNDPPSFVQGGDVTGVAGGGATTVASWATAISPGPPSENGQSVAFIVVSDNPQMFTKDPTVSETGTLSFTLAKKATGSTLVSVTAIDSGGATSAPQSFTISVSAFAGEPGNYYGLVLPSPNGPRENARTGSLRVKITPVGIFTGKLKLAGKSTSFKGRFGNDGAASFGKNGTATLTLRRRGQPALQLALQLDVGGISHAITGTLMQDAAAFSMIETERAIYTAARRLKEPLVNPPPGLIGNYTVIFPALDPGAQGRAADSFPQGDGAGRVKVSKAGAAKLTGWLADGTKISSSSPITQTGRWPLYSASGKTGSVAGFIVFRDIPGSTDLDASDLLWFKAAPKKPGAYPQAWPGGLFLDLAGAKYTAPSRDAPQPALPGLGAPDADGNAEIVFTAGGMPAALPQGVNLDERNRPEFTSVPPPGLKLKLSAGTGLFRGAVPIPGVKKPAKFQGAILQKQALGSGYFFSVMGSGAVDFGPQGAPFDAGRNQPADE